MGTELKERGPHVAGERLGAFVDGELPSAEAEAIGRHLTACPACRTDADALRRAGALLREAVAAEPAPDPEATWQAVRTRLPVGAPAGAPLAAGSRPRLLGWLAAPRAIAWAAAGLLLAAGLAFFLTQQHVPPAPAPAPLPPLSLAAGPPAVVETLEGGAGATVLLYAPLENPVPVIWVFEPEPMETPDAPPSGPGTS